MFFEVLGRFSFAAPMRYRRNPKLQRSYIWRWTFRRKAALIQAIRSGALTFEQARDIYALSIAELQAWERDFERGGGLYGLRAARIRMDRDEKS